MAAAAGKSDAGAPPKGEDMSSREMRGGGYYTKATKGCFDVCENSKSPAPTTQDLSIEAITKVPMPSSGAFTIADYGTADGGTSMFLVRDLIKALRAKKGDQEISVLYEDQPTNDFKPLFLMMQGMMEDGPEPRYLDEFENVFVLASGFSFYQQCSPSGSVHFGYSSTAMHWLRTTPGTIKDALHSSMATEEERKAFQAQASKDWELNLSQRAKEMAPGARLVMVNFCQDDKGCYLGNTAAHGGPKSSMHSNFSRIWQEMAKEGKITQAEYEATNFPQHYRAPAEFTSCIEDESSPLHKAGLRVESITTKVTPCPFRAGWLKGDYESPEAFAKDFLPTLRSWSSGVFLSGLDGSKRSADERQALVDEFYGRYEKEVAASPDDHGMDYVHAYIAIKKEE